MHKYEPRNFNLPDLDGLSPKQIEVHLKLYQGYVKFINTLFEVEADLLKDSEKNAYALGEVHRRLPFEFDGMRMHEHYFEQFEGGFNELSAESEMGKLVSNRYGSTDKFIEYFKAVGMTRGIGWTILYYDPVAKTPHTAWVGDHELGQLSGLPVLCALDMWEHAYMVDYLPAEKKNYIEAFLKNTNWNVVENRINLTIK